MKIRPDHFEQLSAAVRPYLTPEYQAEYLSAGLSLSRYRWDALHASKLDTRPLYAYLNDEHIETALRAALPELRQPVAVAVCTCDRTVCAGGEDCSEYRNERAARRDERKANDQ